MTSRFKNLPLDQYARHVGQVLQVQQAGRQSLSGQEILKVTEFGQLNLMILWLIKTEWNQEAARLQSPYFNYQSQDVRQALEQLMGVLSMNISITPEVLGELATRAIGEIYRLLDHTEATLLDRFDQGGAPALSLKAIQQELKYLPLIAPLVSEPLRHLSMTGRDQVLRGEWIRTVHSAIRDRQSELRHHVETHLSQIAPPDAFVPEPVEEATHAPTSFFDQLEVSTPLVTKTPGYEDSSTYSVETIEVQSEPTSESSYSAPEPEATNPEYTSAPDPEPQSQPQPERYSESKLSWEPVYQPAPIRPESRESAGSLLDRFAQEPSDHAGTLLSRIGTSGPRLTAAFSIGERFFLQSELFDKKAEALSSCLEDLDNQSCLSDALTRLESEYKVTLKWRSDNEAYKTLEQALRRRYA